MIRLFVFVLIILYFLPLCSYADSTDNVLKHKLSLEQKKGLAKDMGIVLPGMTKKEVRETFGLVEPKIGFSASTGQEVWYYSSPEEQNIYFTEDGVVDFVTYKRDRATEPQKEIKELDEI